MQHLDDGRLQEWVDRERSGLGEEEQRAIERHLAVCGDCAERLARLDELERHTRSLLSAGLPDELPDFAGVRGRADTLATGRRRRRVLRGSAWAASVTLALGVGWAANEVSRGRPLASGDPPTPVAAPRAETPAGQAAPRAAERSVEPPQPAEGAGPESTVRTLAEPTGGPEATVVADATPSPPSLPLARSVDAIGAVDVVAVAPAEPRAAVASGSGEEAAALEVAPITRVDPRVVRGRVTDEGGRPIEAAQVFVEGTGIGALTNADGTFLLMLGDAGTVAEARPLTLMVQRIGYGPVSRELTEGRGETLSLDVRLSEQALSLDQVVVTGSGAGARTLELPARIDVAAGVAGAVIVGAAAWAPLGLAEAESRAGFAIASLPGRPIDEVAVESFEGVWVSRVVQTLEGGTAVMLLQARRPILVGDDLREAGQVTASTTRDGFFVVALGAPPIEALQAVLERMR